MMNRSFRAGETRGRTLGTVMKEKEEDLALFLEMRKRDQERNDLLLLHNSEELDPPLLGTKPGGSPIFKIVSSMPARKAAIDDFLNSDSDKNDYDWLLTPPGTPLFPSLEAESKRSPVGHGGTPKARQTILKSRLANPPEISSRSTLTSRNMSSSYGLSSSGMGTRRPSSSGGLSTSSRPATPTGRPTLSAPSKPSRPSTPTSRSTVPPKVVVPPPRSLTPSARSSTPASRSSVPPPNRPVSRPATPTRRNPTSAPPAARSSSVTKPGPMTSKISAPSRGTSPTVRSRPWKPSDMPGFSLDAPSNLRTSLPERPSSASRGRPGAPTTRSSSIVEAEPSVRPRRQSCSPSRGRAPNGNFHSGSSVPAASRSRPNCDSVNPVLIGSKMVERGVNVRRLVPPKQDDKRSSAANNGKSASPDSSSGFGRTLSKKSLDMALRHMDIRRSIPNSLRPLMTNIPASSMYSVRSGTTTTTRSRAVSVSDSPLATSSNASSEQSVNNNVALYFDGIEIEEDDLSRLTS